ncbi:dihydrofolate reductase family protein [Alkalihalobacillus sp. TS-13]|uniref:dihydrofolate reductase family protein n=1 Tax=Alkalihalobacillus sp. TS-13 TaxID=2842455 RepID=UPI001C871C92|nr:dihydrofolate reductase family protein [Alkalihalobacillus sp. TS-13]
MRKVIASTFVSLDGFITAPNGEMDWASTKFNDEMEEISFDQHHKADTMLLGRKTYQEFAELWPSATGKTADEINQTQKVVFSETLQKVKWNNSRLVKGNTGEEVWKLKQQPGKDILIIGSASIVQALTNENLIDEYRIWVFPIIMGSGKPLFKNIKDITNLKLVDTKVYNDTGVVILYYHPTKK